MQVTLPFPFPGLTSIWQPGRRAAGMCVGKGNERDRRRTQDTLCPSPIFCPHMGPGTFYLQPKLLRPRRDPGNFKVADGSGGHTVRGLCSLCGSCLICISGGFRLDSRSAAGL